MTTVNTEDEKARLISIRDRPENKSCADCGARNPRWAAIPYGITICHKCAGVHRNFGTQTSFVRSIDYDNWSEEQIREMELGGNQRWKSFTVEMGINTVPQTEKYNSPLAKKYSRDLLQEARGSKSKVPRSRSAEPPNPSSPAQEPTQLIPPVNETPEPIVAPAKTVVQSRSTEIRPARNPGRNKKKRGGSKPLLIEVDDDELVEFLQD